MAKKRKRAATKRRRRVSGIGSDLTPALAAVGGAVAYRMLSGVMPASIDRKLVSGGAVVAAALLLPKFIKGPLGAGLGAGVAASAGVQLLTELNVISGFYNVPTINGMKRVAGSARQVLRGSAQQVLNGVDLARTSADVRRVSPANYNFATGSNSLSVISGVEYEHDGAPCN